MKQGDSFPSMVGSKSSFRNSQKFSILKKLYVNNFSGGTNFQDVLEEMFNRKVGSGNFLQGKRHNHRTSVALRVLQNTF